MRYRTWSVIWLELVMRYRTWSVIWLELVMRYRTWLNDSHCCDDGHWLLGTFSNSS